MPGKIDMKAVAAIDKRIKHFTRIARETHMLMSTIDRKLVGLHSVVTQFPGGGPNSNVSWDKFTAEREKRGQVKLFEYLRTVKGKVDDKVVKTYWVAIANLWGQKKGATWSKGVFLERWMAVHPK